MKAGFPGARIAVGIGAIFIIGSAAWLVSSPKDDPDSAPTDRAQSQISEPTGADASGQNPAADSAIIRGKYLSDAGNCATCHTVKGAAPFTGGVPFFTALGTIYSSNITPDRETGIGEWTSRDLRDAMRRGIAKDGRHLFPAFPYPSFTKVSDQDVDLIFAYLRSIKPVRSTPPKNSFVFRQRWAMRFWNASFFTPGRLKAQTAKSHEWNRGAYLVEGLGHCSACHTPRNRFMAEIAERAYAGGQLLERGADGKLRRWSAVNLTSAKEGLAAWSTDELTQYLKKGFSSRAGTFGPMNDVIVHSTGKLTVADVRAMAVYLKDLPALESKALPPPAETAKVGAALYAERCEDCHLESGRGGMFTGPPLAGSAIVQAEDPASLINVILLGPTLPEAGTSRAWETMRAYGDVLDDDQVASLSNYLRTSWKNRGGVVTPDDVAAQR